MRSFHPQYHCSLKNQNFRKWVELISTPISNFVQTKANQQETHQNIPKQKRTQKADYSIRVKPNQMTMEASMNTKRKMGLLQVVENGGRWIRNALQEHMNDFVRQKASVDKDAVKERRIRSRSNARHRCCCCLVLFGKWGFESCFSPLVWNCMKWFLICKRVWMCLDSLESSVDSTFWIIQSLLSLLTFSFIIIYSYLAFFFPWFVCNDFENSSWWEFGIL